MKIIWDFIGGRKLFLVGVAMVAILFSRVLGLTDDDLEKILWLALGGSGAIAVEDAAKHLVIGRNGPSG